jgi:hypothetical protein
MVRAFIIFSLVGVVAFAQSPAPPAQDVPILIQMPNSHLTDFVYFYQYLTKRKVWIDAELRFDKQISIFIKQPIHRAEAISLIRDTLRKEGIQIREVGDSEAYVSRAAP